MAIIGKIHKGSGLGDSLFSYISTRSLALRKGYEFGFVGKENFKGSFFMNLDWGKPVELKYHIEYPAGKLKVDDEHILYEPKVNYYDPEFNFIEDGTVIDGCTLQDERYWDIKDVLKWLNVEWLEMPTNICVINFRGGEFYAFENLGLPKEYFEEAIKIIKNIDSSIKFQVHTDDPIKAREFFGGKYPIIQDMPLNWRSLRYAKYSILSNSAFGIIPRLLKQYEDTSAVTISPRYHARRNIKEWSMPSNFYKSFLYL